MIPKTQFHPSETPVNMHEKATFRIHNPEVAGSIPALATPETKGFSDEALCCFLYTQVKSITIKTTIV